MTGWIATRTWDRVARLIITVNDYYLLGIIRTGVEEVKGPLGESNKIPARKTDVRGTHKPLPCSCGDITIS